MVELESPARAKKLMILGGGIGFGLVLMMTYLCITIPWVVDGLTGNTRLRNPQSFPILAVFFMAIFVFCFSWLQYVQWAHDDRKQRGPGTIADLSRKIKTRAMIGIGSVAIIVSVIVLIPSLASMYDIGGSELPDAENWKPFILLFASLGMLSIACLVSVILMFEERWARNRGLSNESW